MFRKFLVFWILLVFISYPIIVNSSSFVKEIEVNFQPLRYIFNGQEKYLPSDQFSFIYQGRTYVPLRFVAESLNSNVKWDGDNYTILLDSIDLKKIQIFKKELDLLVRENKELNFELENIISKNKKLNFELENIISKNKELNFELENNIDIEDNTDYIEEENKIGGQIINKMEVKSIELFTNLINNTLTDWGWIRVTAIPKGGDGNQIDTIVNFSILESNVAGISANGLVAVFVRSGTFTVVAKSGDIEKHITITVDRE